jgi:hypothetical protein
MTPALTSTTSGRSLARQTVKFCGTPLHKPLTINDECPLWFLAAGRALGAFLLD